MRQRLGTRNAMNKLLISILALLLTSCSWIGGKKKDKLDITDKFNSTWNIYETCEIQDDGSIVYHTVPYGGLVAWTKEHNMPVDWSEYEGIRFEFAEPTSGHTQVMISDKIQTLGRPGIKSLMIPFDGQDVRQVDKVMLQTDDSTTLVVKSVRLSMAKGAWEAHMIWEGNCSLGNWENNIMIDASQFKDVLPGDKIELIFHTDTSDPSREYWQFKTLYNDGSEETLEGNDGNLSQWGTANVGREAKSFRIQLTKKDAKRLKKGGLFICGYYNIVTRCNLLCPYQEQTEQ